MSHSDDWFDGDRFRFRRMDEAAGHTMQGMAHLRQELRELRAVVLKLMLCSVRGEELPLEEEPFRGFLHLPESATRQQAMERLMRSQARVLGKLTCPGCGGIVQDKEGVLNETCSWCGYQLKSVE